MRYLTISINVTRYPTHHRWHFLRKTVHWCTCIVRATQSNCCNSLDFLLNHAPQQSELNALTTRCRESYSSVSMSRESKRVKKSRAIGWILAMHWYNIWVRFSSFPVLGGSAQAQVIWGGMVKCSSIAYYMGNISVQHVNSYHASLSSV